MKSGEYPARVKRTMSDTFSSDLTVLSLNRSLGLVKQLLWRFDKSGAKRRQYYSASHIDLDNGAEDISYYYNYRMEIGRYIGRALRLPVKHRSVLYYLFYPVIQSNFHPDLLLGTSQDHL